MLKVAGVVLISLVICAPGAFAAEGFELDLEPRELRERTNRWQLQDLSVGESGYIFGGFLCAADDRLYALGRTVLTEKSDYSASLRVTVKPDRRLSLEVLPKKKASGRLKPEDLGFFSGLVNCESHAGHWRDGGLLYQIDSINGQTSLSKLLDVVAKPADPKAADADDIDKMLTEMFEESGKPDTEGDDPLPEWRITESRSKIDDSPSVFMSLYAVKKIAARFGLQRPSMHIRCRENTTSIYFVVEDFFIDDRTTVTYRFDAARAETVEMPISTDRKAFGLWEGATAIPFIRRLFGKERLVARVAPRGSASRTFEFALRGLEEKIAALRKACHW